MILRIRALARRKPAGHQRTLRAAGVELNLAHAHRHPRGRALDLSNTEFAVHETLLDASAEILSAEQLLQEAFGTRMPTPSRKP